MERPPSTNGDTNDLWERRANQRDARRQQLRLKRCSRIALTPEEVRARGELSEQRIQFIVNRNRHWFESLTGVSSNLLPQLHEKLSRVIATGDTSIAELLDQLDQGRRNGSGSVDESGS